MSTVMNLPSAPRLETRHGAYELKFILPETQVEGVINWARAHLSADPHAAQFADETYSIHSVYLDTPDLAVYRRRPGFQNSKFRLRRYGAEETIYLEEKRKSEGWVSKVRTGITERELDLLQAATVPAGWTGAWFREALWERRLVPCCHVAYRRLAREGKTPDGPVRLTLDREIRCSDASGLLPARDFQPHLPIPITLLELKYRNEFPPLFQNLVHRFDLRPASASKYQRAAETCGRAAQA